MATLGLVLETLALADHNSVFNSLFTPTAGQGIG